MFPFPVILHLFRLAMVVDTVAFDRNEKWAVYQPSICAGTKCSRQRNKSISTSRSTCLKTQF